MRYLWLTLSTLFVLAAFGAPFLLGPKDRAAGAGPGAAAAAPPARVEDETDYYVLLSAVEVEPEAADGRRWDADGSPPDVYYEVHWQGQEVFESTTKKDTLLARWTNVGVGLGDVVGEVSLDDSIKAARIAARPGDTLEFRVYDEDLARHDRIGSFTVEVARLQVGDQRWERPAGRLRRVECRVVPIGDVAFDTLVR